LRSSYALTFKPCAGRLTGVAAASVERRSTTRWDAAAGYARALRRRGISYIGKLHSLLSAPEGRPRPPKEQAPVAGGKILFFSWYRISRSILIAGRVAGDCSVSRPSVR